MNKKFIESNLRPKDFWEQRAAGYIEELSNSYHQERLDTLAAFLKNMDLSRKSVLDFGCGDGQVLLELAQQGANVTGIDISENMINHARSRFGDVGVSGTFHTGGIEVIDQVPPSTIDVLLALNVLAYLQAGEEEAFFASAANVLRDGGCMLLIESNELFDLFTFNAFTIAFLEKHLVPESRKSDCRKLLSNPDVPNCEQFQVRLNPLSFPKHVEQHGFKEIDRRFLHYHSAPPLLDNSDAYEKLPSNIDGSNEWTLMFKCSMYASKLLKCGKRGE